jgi:Icc protein
MARSTAPRLAMWALTLVALSGCLEYSPHALPTDSSERDLNAKAIALLHVRGPADPARPLRLAVIGDVHNSYEELDAAIERVNAIGGIELVVQLGDFTHLGTLQEFRLSKERFDRLRVPYLVTIGNHDLLGRGGAIFDRMFGARDVAFVHRGVRFVFLDTNSREYGLGAGVPRLDWLAAELRQGDAGLQAVSPQRTILFAHVPPISADFDADLEPAYHALLRGSRAVAAFYGHDHRFERGEQEEVPYWIADSLDRRSLLVVTVSDDAVQVEREVF